MKRMGEAGDRPRTFGDNVRQAIADQKTSNTAIAEKLGVLPQRVDALARPSNDNPTLETIFKLAKALDVSVESLVEHLDPDYDAKRAARPIPERLVETWTRAAQRAPRQTDLMWEMLLEHAGAPSSPAAEGGGASSTSPARLPDPSLATK